VATDIVVCDVQPAGDRKMHETCANHVERVQQARYTMRLILVSITRLGCMACMRRSIHGEIGRRRCPSTHSLQILFEQHVGAEAVVVAVENPGVDQHRTQNLAPERMRGPEMDLVIHMCAGDLLKALAMVPGTHSHGFEGAKAPGQCLRAHYW
jgi:hypothetical protein